MEQLMTPIRIRYLNLGYRQVSFNDEFSIGQELSANDELSIDVLVNVVPRQKLPCNRMISSR